MLSPPVLAHPEFLKEFVLATEASDLAVRAVLQQRDANGMHTTAFYSRKLKEPELNWTVGEKETLAQVLACWP